MREGNNMKAYQVDDKYSNRAELVYADKAGEAKSRAYGCDNLHDVEWVDLRARRFKEADDTEHLTDKERACFLCAYGWWYEEGTERWDDENWRDLLRKLTKVEQNRVLNMLTQSGIVSL